MASLLSLVVMKITLHEVLFGPRTSNRGPETKSSPVLLENIATTLDESLLKQRRRADLRDRAVQPSQRRESISRVQPLSTDPLLSST